MRKNVANWGKTKNREKTKWMVYLVYFGFCKFIFFAIIEKNIEKRTIFLSIAFESGKSGSGPK